MDCGCVIWDPLIVKLDEDTVLIYKDAIVFIKSIGGYANTPMILFQEVVKNLYEKIEEIIQNFENMKDGKLQEKYDTCIGWGCYVCINPEYGIIEFVKSKTKYCIICEGNVLRFRFMVKDFEDFLGEWEHIVNHMKLNEIETLCSLKNPCKKKSCYNCKVPPCVIWY